MKKNIETFKKNGYCVVRNAIPEEIKNFVTQYALFDEMQNFQEGDSQVPNAYSSYADPAMETILINLQKVMEENTGLSLHPTYSYYRVYRNGDVLVPHSDRESCEISATMCLNYSYDDEKFMWPIYMAGNRVDLYPGDMVIYRGCDLEHWREPLRCDEDVWHVQAFFHYVDANGPNAEWKFDKREMIGATKTKRISYPDYITFTK